VHNNERLRAQVETSEVADRGLGAKQSSYHEPPTPWSSADAVASSQRRSSSSVGRDVYHVVNARPPSVPPGKRAQLSDSQFIILFFVSLSRIFS